MRVTLFGTRGSLPAPGAATALYGGNTSTVKISENDHDVLILDAGTGIRQLGEQIPPEIERIDILLTHLHLDHILGLGFFAPIFDPTKDVHIWGPPSSRHSLDTRLSRYLSPPLFPVHLRDLPHVKCHATPNTSFKIGPFNVQATQVCHPGPTVGYRVEANGGTTVYLPDHEPALGRKDGALPDPEWISGYELAKGADLLIHDSQYGDEEYAHRVGWGHSSYRQTFEFASLASVKHLVPFHHDPSHDDATLDKLLEEAITNFRPGYQVSAGREGAIFDVGRK